MTTVKLIAKVGPLGQLETPWGDPEYLKELRRLTHGQVVVVGHRTGRTLPILTGRVVCIMERNETPHEIMSRYFGRTIWVAGGSQTYKDWMPFVKQSVIHMDRTREPSKKYMPPLWRRPRISNL